MSKDPEKSQNFNESKDLEEDDDYETEEDIKWRWKLRIIAIIIIVLCSSSIIISVIRRNVLGHKGVGSLEEYDDFLSDDDDDLNIESANPRTGSNGNEVNVKGNNVNSNGNNVSSNGKGNENDNGNENSKTEKSEPNDQPPSSPETDGELSTDSEEFESNKDPALGPSFFNSDSIVEPPITIIIDEGNEDSSPVEGTVEEVENIPLNGSGENPAISNTIVVTETIEEEPIEGTYEADSNAPPKPLQVKKSEPPKIKVCEPEFVNLQADDSDEDLENTGVIVKPESFEVPKGRFFYETDNARYKLIDSVEYSKNSLINFKTDFEFLPFSSKYASISFTSNHKKLAFALIDDNCKQKKASRIIVKDYEQMSTLEICGGEGNYCYDPHISPDGKLVIYRKGDWKTLYYYNIETGIETKLDLPPNSFKYTPKFFADSKRFVFVALLNRKFKIVVSNIFNTQKSKCIFESATLPIELAVSPNGRYIAFNLKSFIKVVAVNDKERLDKKFKFGMPLPSPENAKVTDFYNYTTKQTMIFVEEYPKFFRPFWSPDGMFLFFSASGPELYYTGFGFDEWKTFRVYRGMKICGFITDLPVMQTENIVKSALDDIINQVGVLNLPNEEITIASDTKNFINEPSVTTKVQGTTDDAS